MKTEKQEQVLQFGERQILYYLYRTNRKRVRIVVSPELTVDVFAPKAVDDEQVRMTVQKKALWITWALDRMKSFHPLPAPKQYISGEPLLYLGRQYQLKVEETVAKPAKLLGPFLWVRVSDRSDTRSIKRAVDRWYRKRAFETFGRYLQKCYAMVVRYDIPEPTMAVRVMRRRWGSCTDSGRITLNVNLVQVPRHCIEYVILHELCHLKHLNHSRSFYEFLSCCMPDWRSRKEMLDRFLLE
ncbi:MAG: SprT family zinc-dependent metalloprotease [Desulfobacterales bacterium]|nr:SprT family zinc-dependent metalloprotease [Desulfobacterales bacterium]MDD4072828.1 SprT family zinc-dependent metalloprotease [Desulfobacterales bacterium]MDD4391300.1 SprT family zinc-dependent metalloprotease [Desulfobacterales bacterium]